MPFVLLTCILTGIVGRFSRSYLHHESGYARFFLLMLMFLVGMLCLTMGGTIDLLFAGWELVGLASALLIGFFQHRKEPVLNGLRTFAVYRICDVGLLVGAILLHRYAHTAEFDVAFAHAHWPLGLPDIPTAPLNVIGLLFLLAAIGKSGQVPFGNWLPRAMEGPTPSSAIFYGGISIHAGAYLLLRMAPLLERSSITMASIVVIGLLTALYGTLVGRVQCDMKNQLAYSAMAQVGLIFVEIGFGLYSFALLHMGGHATLRTLQFLRSATVLREFNRLKAATGGELARNGGQYEFLFPLRLRRWLYTAAIRGCDLDAGLQWALVGPLMKTAAFLERIEDRWAGNTDAKRKWDHP
jgi:NADH:ubiquinone oxidoreductase subunit 5 (subunit L)/multisubunit Na+/H+ antiporter MnhA subunit